VVIAPAGRRTANISAGIVMVNRLTLHRLDAPAQSIANKGRMAQGLKEKVWPLLEAGTVRPIIYKTFALKDAARRTPSSSAPTMSAR
jgi:NADPH2:quinone reductase